MDEKDIRIAVQQNEINNLTAIKVGLQVELEKMARELETYKEDNARLEESQSH